MKFASLLCRALSLAGVLAVAAPAGWSAPPPQSGIIEYEVQATGTGQPVKKMTQKTWFKGSKLRQETDTPQGKMTAIMGPDGMYFLPPGSKSAMKAPGKAPANAGLNMLIAQVAQVKQHGKKVGSEKVGRYQADIYEQSSEAPAQPGAPKTKITKRIWISSSVPVPVKVVNNLPRGQIVMTLKSAQFNGAVPDSMFQLPKGMKVTTAQPPPGMPPGRPAPR